MSHYGPPHGSPPPGEPYHGGRPAGDDRPPADPWGGAPEPSWGQPPATPPGGYPPGGYLPGGYPPGGYRPPMPSPPPPASPPRTNFGLYALVAVLVLLAAAGVGYALFLLSGDDEDPQAGDRPGPTSTAGGSASPGATPSPGDNIGLSAAVARVGDCLVNEGSSEETAMRIVRCDEELDGDDVVVYRVLAVLEEQVQGDDNPARLNSAQQICSGTEGYTHHYFEVATENSFVLCMAEVG